MSRIMGTVKSDTDYDFNSLLFEKAFIYTSAGAKENLDAVSHIEFGKYIREGTAVIGAKFVNKNISLVEMFSNCIEKNIKLKNVILSNCTELSEREVIYA